MKFGDIEQSGNASFKRGSFYFPELKRCYVTYKDADEAYVGTGFGTCKDKYFEITTEIEHTMTSIALGADWHYLYVDHSESVWPTPTIIDSTTDPAWSDVYQNYYNGDDLLFGALYSSDAEEFLAVGGTIGKGRKSYPIQTLLSNGNPDGTWTALAASAYFPVNVSGMYIDISNSDIGSDCTVQVGVGNNNTDQTIFLNVYCERATNAKVRGWLYPPVNWTGNLYWSGSADDDNNYQIRSFGYQDYRP